MKQIICSYTLIPIRKDPDHRAEQVSQLLFGERAEILLKRNGWINIKTTFDQYNGWIEDCTAFEVNMESSNSKVIVVSEPVIQAFSNSNRIYIPAGSEIPLNKDRKSFDLEGRNYLLTEPIALSGCPLIETALKFLHAPYLWGGRTAFGIDCSGLSQIAYKISGISLPRDAKDQSNIGKSINTIDDALPKDLFFFGESKEKISHVGIYTGNNCIIHASKIVRIDTVDSKGIYNTEIEQYTHILQKIQRVK